MGKVKYRDEGVGSGHVKHWISTWVQWFKRVVRKSDHASDNYTCGPTIVELDCITASLTEPSSVFHLLVGLFSASKLE